MLASDRSVEPEGRQVRDQRLELVANPILMRGQVQRHRLALVGGEIDAEALDRAHEQLEEVRVRVVVADERNLPGRRSEAGVEPVIDDYVRGLDLVVERD